MALETYTRKRDFGKTSEPRPGRITSRSGKLSYLIQKHDATRLHYDFRLEFDGVLLSWALTRGPSVDPAVKRLAVRTEDHPLAYGDFEGTIPEGQYGGGTVMLWDQGTWEPKGDAGAALKKGHLAFTLYGKRLTGGWDLIRMRGKDKRENWLLIKNHDEEARRGAAAESFLDGLAFSVKSGRSMDEISAGKRKPVSRPQKVAAAPKTLEALIRTYPDVQLATLVQAPPEGEEWVHEIKFDGYRLLGYASRGDVRLRTRNGLDWTAKLPAIAAALERLEAHSAVVDMEAVVLDEQGHSDFQALQAALGEGGDRDRIVAYAFDLLHLDGKDLAQRPTTERKEPLEALLKKSRTGESLRFSEHFTGNGKAILEKCCGLGLEGIISKRADAHYSAGRGKLWLKSKCTRRQEFVIVGYSDAAAGGRALGAVYLGYHENGVMRYAGKVGTGFTINSARALTQRLKSLATGEPVFARQAMAGTPSAEWRAVHWVLPKLLCEVAFTEWTHDGRIRHPSFQGLREDKVAAEVEMEKPVPAPDANQTPVRDSNPSFRGVAITHPERVISETGHITKRALAAYHDAVAELMMQRLAGHPLSLLRCPAGIGQPCFFQRNPGKGLGPDVKPFKFRHKGKTYEYLYIDDAKGLIELVQMGTIEIHHWGAPVDAIDYPDRMTFDLDPAPDVPFEAVKLAAQDLRQKLRQKGLEAALKTTGGKGLHVMIPLAGKDKWPEVKAFAAALAGEMVAVAPSAYVATMSKVKRTGRIFLDYFRNDYTATAIADYAVRARPGAPVATPLDWKELPGIKDASQFAMNDVLERLKRRKPPIWPAPQQLPR